MNKETIPVVLIIGDDSNESREAKALLKQHGFTVVITDGIDEAKQLVEAARVVAVSTGVQFAAVVNATNNCAASFEDMAIKLTGSDFENQLICPVDIPQMLRVKKERKNNHWRGGSTKKGGKVGYERR